MRRVWRGISKQRGPEFTAESGKRPLLTGDLRRVVHALGDGLIDDRDRALLTVGFAGAMRRSEIVGLDVQDLEFTDEGLLVTIRRSKTDQVGVGRTVGLPFASDPKICPVRSAGAWISRVSIESGPVFRPVDRRGQASAQRLSGKAVWRIVRQRVAAAGLDPSEFGAHSLRSGLATSAARAGASDRAIMDITGHRSRATLDRYVRAGRIFRDNAAAAALGLPGPGEA